jgi:hypothetical protein
MVRSLETSDIGLQKKTLPESLYTRRHENFKAWQGVHYYYQKLKFSETFERDYSISIYFLCNAINGAIIRHWIRIASKWLLKF